MKWTLSKQYHRMSDHHCEQLEACFADSPTLEQAYWVRERFHHILDNSSTVEEVFAEMEVWLSSMKPEVKDIFAPFIETWHSRKEYIANYVKNNLSNAVTEGVNNLIRSIKRVAFGMPNFEHLRWRALAIST